MLADRRETGLDGVDQGLVSRRELTRPRDLAEADGGTDRRVKDDVVLAHEIEVTRFGILPPVAPRVGTSDHAGPFDRSGEVTDDGVEPHVHALIGPILPTRERDRHAPIDIAR